METERGVRVRIRARVMVRVRARATARVRDLRLWSRGVKWGYMECALAGEGWGVRQGY